MSAPENLEANSRFFLKYEDKIQSEKFLPILVNMPHCLRFLQETWTPHEHQIDKEGQIYSYKADDQWNAIELISVRDVRIGVYARKKDVPPNLNGNVMNLFTIVYGPNCTKLTFLDLYCVDKDFDLKSWAHAFMAVSYNIYENCPTQLDCIRRSYYKLMIGSEMNSALIPFSSLLKFWGVSANESAMMAKMSSLMRKYDVKLEGESVTNPMIEKINLNPELYKNMFNLICDPPFIESLYNKCKKGEFMTLDELTTFLTKTQKERYDQDFRMRSAGIFIITKFEKEEELMRANRLSCQGFRDYLMSPYNSVCNRDQLTLCDDMSLPLTSYYIKSSHNTYLAGHQLKGASSIEMYRQVLLTGCRCVELDCYNDGNVEVKITHGNFLLVTPILFRDAIKAIAECAFKTSEYPVILSFENHCSERNQGTMAQYCIDLFGEYLLSEPLESHPLVKGSPLPSPTDLKYKILIKNKKHKGVKANADSANALTLTAASSNILQAIPENISGDASHCGLPIIPSLSMNSSNSNAVIPESNMDNLSCEDTELSEVDCMNNKLSDIINYIEPVTFKSFQETIDKTKFHEMSSFSEDKALSLLRQQQNFFIKYNHNNNSRIYPRNTRISSLNFVPTDFWNVGCQMVALNYQSVDPGMLLNMSLFQFNSFSGYNLKPEYLRDPQKMMNVCTNTAKDAVSSKLVITIHSGQCIGDKKSKVAVEVEVVGINEDNNKQKTPAFPTQSPLVDFHGCELTFSPILNGDVAFLKFTVQDDKQDRVYGYRIIPLRYLKNGYRFVELKTDLHQPVNLAALFVHISLDVFITEETCDMADFLLNPELMQNITLDSTQNSISCPSLTDNNTEPLCSPNNKLPPRKGTSIAFAGRRMSILDINSSTDSGSDNFDANMELKRYFDSNMKVDAIIIRVIDDKQVQTSLGRYKQKIKDMINSHRRDVAKSAGSSNESVTSRITRSLSFSKTPKAAVEIPSDSFSEISLNDKDLINKIRSNYSALKILLKKCSEKITKKISIAESRIFVADIKNLAKEKKRGNDRILSIIAQAVSRQSQAQDKHLTEKNVSLMTKLETLEIELKDKRTKCHQFYQKQMETVKTQMTNILEDKVASVLDEIDSFSSDNGKMKLQFPEFDYIFYETMLDQLGAHWVMNGESGSKNS